MKLHKWFVVGFIIMLVLVAYIWRATNDPPRRSGGAEYIPITAPDYEYHPTSIGTVTPVPPD